MCKDGVVSPPHLPANPTPHRTLAPVLAIVGPTGSSKSALALHLATQRDGEVVSCDSVQVYRGFHIGCAKPTADERARVPHHGLDLVDAHEPYDAAAYAAMATAAIADIQGRGRRAIVCGGTGLYLRALRYGLIPAESSEGLRQQLDRLSLPELRERLRAVDPVSAARIEPNNRVQLQRAVEISELSQEPASAVRSRHGFAEALVPMRVVVLRWPRDTLRDRLRRRVHAMLAAGWVDEVRGLLAAGVAPTARPMQAVGYREVCAVATGMEPLAGLEERIFLSTWHYAKRQLTWWRKARDIAWLDMDASWYEDTGDDPTVSNERALERLGGAEALFAPL